MAVIEYDSYKQKLLAMSDTFENLQKALDIESSKHEIARLEAEAACCPSWRRASPIWRSGSRRSASRRCSPASTITATPF